MATQTNKDSTFLPTALKRNVQTIARLEQELFGRRTGVERVGNWVAQYFGSIWFVVAHMLGIGTWVTVNAGPSDLAPFDPYPFPLLGLLVGVEFIVLTTFVLMNQAHQLRRQEQWAHLNLQITILSEQGVTKTTQMLQLICERLGLDGPSRDPEVRELAQATPVLELAEAIGKAQSAGEAAVLIEHQVTGANRAEDPAKGAK